MREAPRRKNPFFQIETFRLFPLAPSDPPISPPNRVDVRQVFPVAFPHPRANPSFFKPPLGAEEIGFRF